MGNALWLLVTGVVSFAVCVAVFLCGRGKGYRNFSHWWDAEGVPIWIISGIVVWVIIDMQFHRFH